LTLLSPPTLVPNLAARALFLNASLSALPIDRKRFCSSSDMGVPNLAARVICFSISAMCSASTAEICSAVGAGTAATSGVAATSGAVGSSFFS